MGQVLIIDPEPSRQGVLSSRVRDSTGQEARVVETLARGLSAAQTGEFDAVLVAEDLHGPVDGYEAARRLRGMPGFGRSPIVVYSDLPETAARLERAIEAGCDQLLGKAGMGALGSILTSLLRRKAEFDELLKRRQEAASVSTSALDAAGRAEGNEADGTARPGEPNRTRPDGVMIVDVEGVVLHADRWVTEALGTPARERTLGSLLPGSGLEAFVRDARTEPRAGLRFDISRTSQREARSLSAAVTPLCPENDQSVGGLRVVTLFDQTRRPTLGPGHEDRKALLEPQLASLIETARATYRPEAWIGSSMVSRAIRSLLAALLDERGPVLLHGPAGIGRERCARILHYGGRRRGPFLKLRCPALSRQNLDRELFGYQRGAFPGAVADHPGLVALAREGTIYLEEIDALPPETQARLVDRLRDTSTAKDRALPRWIVSALRDPEELVAEGRLIRPLYALWKRSVIELPALRERPEDLVDLASHFLATFGAARGVRSFSASAAAAMRQYDWPGNVDELESCIERACARARDGEIELDDLSRPVRTLRLTTAWQMVPEGPVLAVAGSVGLSPISDSVEWTPQPWDISADDPISLELYEKKALLRALDSCNGDKLAAARLLKLGKSTLYRKLRRFGIT